MLIFAKAARMPLDNDAMLGTEKDGSKNQQYCKILLPGWRFYQAVNDPGGDDETGKDEDAGNEPGS